MEDLFTMFTKFLVVPSLRGEYAKLTLLYKILFLVSIMRSELRRFLLFPSDRVEAWFSKSVAYSCDLLPFSRIDVAYWSLRI